METNYDKAQLLYRKELPKDQKTKHTSSLRKNWKLYRSKQYRAGR